MAPPPPAMRSLFVLSIWPQSSPISLPRPCASSVHLAAPSIATRYIAPASSHARKAIVLSHSITQRDEFVCDRIECFPSFTQIPIPRQHIKIDTGRAVIVPFRLSRRKETVDVRDRRGGLHIDR